MGKRAKSKQGSERNGGRSKGRQPQPNRKISKKVTADSIIKSNIDSLKTCYNSIPRKTRKGRGVSALNSGNDIALISAVFGKESKDTSRLAIPPVERKMDEDIEMAKRMQTDPRVAMLFADDLKLPKRGGLLILVRMLFVISSVIDILILSSDEFLLMYSVMNLLTLRDVSSLINIFQYLC